MGTIVDGTGSNREAKVDERQRLLVRAFAESISHTISDEDELAFDISSSQTLSSGSLVCLTFTNNYEQDRIVIDKIKMVVLDEAGGSALPNADNHFSITCGETYSSGGSVVTPVNLTCGSNKSLNATVYGNNPTMGGTLSELERKHPISSGEELVLDEGGALIVQPTNTLTVRYVGNQTSGTAYVHMEVLVMEVHA